MGRICPVGVLSPFLKNLPDAVGVLRTFVVAGHELDLIRPADTEAEINSAGAYVL